MKPSPIGRGWLRSSRVRGCGMSKALTSHPLIRRLRRHLLPWEKGASAPALDLRATRVISAVCPKPFRRRFNPAGARRSPIRSSRATAFVLPAHRFGNVAIGIQPARGYNIDPKASYHDPDLVPPHAYFAFYFWLREEFGADALIHMGKHGNLEWLPGKALALSRELLSGGGARAAAGDLSLHRQRSGRGGAGEAPHRCGRRRSSDAADGARREPRAGGGDRAR